MLDKLRSLGGGVLIIAFLAALGCLGSLFIYGSAWLGSKMYPWLISICSLALFILIFILLPLTIFRKTRTFAGNGMIISSYIFGITLWVLGLLSTFTLWGGFAVFIGLAFFGIGVVPLAMLATLFKGMWSTLGELFILTLLTFGTRIAGFFTISKG